MAKVLQKAARRQLNGLDAAVQSTSRMLPKSATPATVSLDGGNCPACKGRSRGGNALLFVPVVSSTGAPLMPCHPARARKLVCKGRAIRRFSKGIFYVKLLDRAEGKRQLVACGIDPGSKKEGLTVKSAAHTFLNIQADAVTWVKDAVETRRNMRRGRRFRNTPCRPRRYNRTHGCLPPSTKARWDWKLRLVVWLTKLCPISMFVVEDTKARTTGKWGWDHFFSPLEVGKQWFYDELMKISPVVLKQGWETKQLRDELGLKKIGSKLAEVFEAHCIDSWVLANWWTGGHLTPDNTTLFCVTPLRFHRRQLHVFQPAKGGRRKLYGSTRSLGLKRGSIVKHPKYGIVCVGGTAKAQISLHTRDDGWRLCRNAKPADCKFLTYNSWRIRFLSGLKSGVSVA